MKIQKFKHGDKVKVAKNLGSTMAHFRNDFEAIVMYSYASKYGVDHDGNYGIMACDTGNECAWYNENQLTLIEHVGQKGIDIIKERKEEKEKQESNMDWIWDNWKEIRTAVPGATMCELMKRIGITEPWGSRGEGVQPSCTK